MAQYTRFGAALEKALREQSSATTANAGWMPWEEPTGHLIELVEIVVTGAAGVATKELVGMTIQRIREFVAKLREHEDEHDWRNPGAYF